MRCIAELLTDRLWVRIPCGVLWPLSLKVRTQPFQGWDIGFKSHRGHCDHSITASTADCGSAHGGSVSVPLRSVQSRRPPDVLHPPGHIWVGKP